MIKCDNCGETIKPRTRRYLVYRHWPVTELVERLCEKCGGVAWSKKRSKKPAWKKKRDRERKSGLKYPPRYRQQPES
jgi:hypothetical protein